MSHEITIPDFTMTLTIDGDEYVADFADTRKLQAANAMIVAIHDGEFATGEDMQAAMFALMPDMRSAIASIIGSDAYELLFGADDAQTLRAASLVGSLVVAAAEFYISR